MTDLEKIQKQLKRFGCIFCIKRFSVGQELRIYYPNGIYLGSLYFDLEGVWQN